MTDDLARTQERLDRAQGVAAAFQVGTLGWIRRRGLDFEDYCAYLASISWATTKPGVGARRMADVMAAQIAAPGVFDATATGDDAEARIELVGPDPEALAWGGASADDAVRQVELIFGPVARRLTHIFELRRHDSGASVTIRPKDPAGG